MSLCCGVPPLRISISWTTWPTGAWCTTAHRYWSNLPVAWEGELAAAADVCFAASDGLVDRLAPCNENIALLPNGVNYPLFCRELVDTPPELTDLADKPVLGFIGSLRADLDVAPLLLAADRHPEWTFLLVGPAEPSAYLPQLEERENIRLVGKRPWSSCRLPELLPRLLPPAARPERGQRCDPRPHL